VKVVALCDWARAVPVHCDGESMGSCLECTKVAAWACALCVCSFAAAAAGHVSHGSDRAAATA
jgi:hypothetical protein